MKNDIRTKKNYILMMSCNPQPFATGGIIRPRIYLDDVGETLKGVVDEELVVLEKAVRIELRRRKLNQLKKI